MPKRHLIFIGLATSLFLALLFLPEPATAQEVLMEGEIPLMEGARVVQEKVEGSMGHFVLEVPASVADVVDFYRQAMADQGWPPGSVSTIGDRGAIMLNDGQRQFALRAERENDHTKVILMLTGP
jgi:hypothetical protein